jgi:hypothetical protein
MARPWTKKKPLMSLWLSGANAMAGRARSAGSAETSGQRKQLTKVAPRFWAAAWFGTAKSKFKSKRKAG